MKKFLSLLLALTFCGSAAALAGCGSKIGEEEFTGGDGSGGNLVIGCQDAGFGLDWLKDMAKSFAAKENVNVKVAQITNGSEAISQIEAGTCSYDIVMTLGSAALFKLSKLGYTEELTEKVYNQTPEGEEKTIAEKMNPYIYEAFKDEEGKLYLMSWADASMSIFYNKSTLDEIYGENNWSLPRTTDELISMCTEIKDTTTNAAGQAEKYYPFSGTGKTNYADYIINSWSAQYDGIEKYLDYYNLLYTKEDGTKAVADTYDQIAPKGRVEALKVMETIHSIPQGYLHPSALEMDYLEAQSAFAGNGFRGVDMTQCAFIVSGSWLENELTTDLVQNPQEIGMMRTPVISSIINVLPEGTIIDDEMLQKTVTQIDAGKSWEEAKAADSSLANVAEADYEYVSAARRCLNTGAIDHDAAIPKKGASEANKENAFKFLTFMASDAGQKIYSDRLGGLTQAYGYMPDLSDSTYFVKTVMEQVGKDYIPVYTDCSSIYVSEGGLSYMALNDRTSGLMQGTYTAETLNSKINAQWSQMFDTIKSYGKK